MLDDESTLVSEASGTDRGVEPRDQVNFGEGELGMVDRAAENCQYLIAHLVPSGSDGRRQCDKIARRIVKAPRGSFS